ncbi:uncharacterized protein IL334_004482 [Kwoniella shivajii]|uniref:Uncharacterized protein n=1 Tax=Kwoniella shivajii TaxID=564305 RepID=A0ABZ1D0F0_9TREE|nr:hypothetical protein IL334_004482 [Kwoniella shivajii]
MEDHPLIELHPVLIHLAAIPAVVIGSYKALNVWRAVSALPVNTHSGSLDNTPSSPVSGTLKQWRALTATKKAKRVATFLLAFTIAFSVNMFFIFGLPRISSQVVLDTVWCTLLVLLLTGSFRYSSDVAIPTTKAVRYHQKTPESGFQLAFSFEGDKKRAFRIEMLRRLFAMFGAFSVIYSTWAGYTFLHPIIGATYLIKTIGTIRFPTMSIRRIVQIMAAYLTLVPTLGFALGTVIDHFMGQSENAKEESQTTDMTMASDWILSMILVIGDVFGAMVPSVIVAMTLRFEYSLVSEPVDYPSDSSPDAPVRVPSDYPSFPKPIFLISLFSLFSGLAIVETISFVFPGFEWIAITPITVFITLPVVVLGTSLGAAWYGQFGQWWRYSEVWIPGKKTNDSSENGLKAEEIESEVALLRPQEKDSA